MPSALQSTTKVERHVIGDLVIKFYTVSGTNGDTLLVPGVVGIQMVIPIPTTAIAVGYTVSGTTITFVTAGAFAAKVAVICRNG